MHTPRTNLRGWRNRRGKLRLAMLPVILLAAGLAVVLTSPEASAGAGAPSEAGVQPTEVNLGGQPNDCVAVGSAASYELRIENPQDQGVYTNPDPDAPAGVSFTLSVYDNDEHLDFDLAGDAVVLDVVIKGGQKSTHYDYLGSAVGPVRADDRLHAPTKGGGASLYNISHLSFCYEDATQVSGVAYVDECRLLQPESPCETNGERDPDEGPDIPRTITAYDANGDVYAQTTSSAVDGSYDMFLKIGETYTICQQPDPVFDFVQTEPNSSTPGYVACASPPSEPGGYSVQVATSGNGDLDFGREGVCGQNLTTSGGVFVDATFELFEGGNGESGCQNKVGQLSVTESGVLALPLVGSGEVAGIGTITKQFPVVPETTPPTFTALTYSRNEGGPYYELPWCLLRDKVVGADGDQFDPYLSDDTKYPSLDGVTDPGGPSVACKVYVDENIEGTQTTVVLIQDDPFWL